MDPAATTATEKARAQIRKLLALGHDDGATEAEAENALRFARRLMLAHHLTEGDVTERDPHENAARAERVSYGQAAGWTTGAGMTAWEATLGWAIVDLVGTVGWYKASGLRRTPAGALLYGNDGNPQRSTRVTFYGPEDDARDAIALYDEWSITVAALARMRFGGALRGEGRSYAEGFTRALREKVGKIDKAEREQITAGRDNGCTALALVNARALIVAKKQGAENWLRHTQGLKLRKSSSNRGGRFHGNAYEAGRSDGQRANFSRQSPRRLGQ